MKNITGFTVEFEVQVPSNDGWYRFLPRVTGVLRATCAFDPSHQDVLSIFSSTDDPLDKFNHDRILRGDYRKFAVSIFQKDA